MPKTSGTGKRTVRAKARFTSKDEVQAADFYPADDVKTRIPRNFTPGTAKLRASITPGTVLILLTGRHKGKRVVFLKQMPSGLLLVTGPFKINGVPLRRVNQSYVIATSTKIDASAAAAAADVEDSYFKGEKSAEGKDEKAFFAAGKPVAVEIAAERKALQKKVDSALMGSINSTPDMKAYLKAKFRLTRNSRPHEMVF